jgi:hypothetical protein
LIFNLYPRVLIKVGDERRVFDRATLMFTEVAEVEKVTGLSFGEWQAELGRYSITAVGALLHVLRKRDGGEDDFETMNFGAYDLDVVPLHDDDTEFTAEEVAADLAKRLEEAQNPVPTIAADLAASGESPEPGTTAGTSPSSPGNSGSVPGNGTS